MMGKCIPLLTRKPCEHTEWYPVQFLNHYSGMDFSVKPSAWMNLTAAPTTRTVLFMNSSGYRYCLECDTLWGKTAFHCERPLMLGTLGALYLLVTQLRLRRHQNPTSDEPPTPELTTSSPWSTRWPWTCIHQSWQVSWVWVSSHGEQDFHRLLLNIVLLLTPLTCHKIQYIGMIIVAIEAMPWCKCTDISTKSRGVMLYRTEHHMDNVSQTHLPQGVPSGHRSSLIYIHELGKWERMKHRLPTKCQSCTSNQSKAPTTGALDSKDFQTGFGALWSFDLQENAVGSSWYVCSYRKIELWTCKFAGGY